MASDTQVDAVAEAIWNATRPGIMWAELREASREPIRVQARAALEAAERVRGERVVYASEGRRTLEIYNGVHLEFQETLRHKDVLVIRKAVK